MGGRRKKRDGIQRVDVTGKKPELWAVWQPKLIEKIHDVIDKLLSMQIDSEKGTTVRDEAVEIGSLAVRNIKARLKKAVVQNKKDEAEIIKAYAEAEHKYEEANKTRAEARKLNAEAEAKELKNTITKLVTALKLSKVMLVGFPGEEAVLFGRQIGQYIDVLEESIKQLTS